MKFFLFPLAIIFHFCYMAQTLTVQSFDSIPTVLIISKSLPETECNNQTEDFVVKYSAPTVSITVKSCH